MNIDKQIEYIEEQIRWYSGYSDNKAWSKDLGSCKAILKTLKEVKENTESDKSVKELLEVDYEFLARTKR